MTLTEDQHANPRHELSNPSAYVGYHQGTYNIVENLLVIKQLPSLK